MKKLLVVIMVCIPTIFWSQIDSTTMQSMSLSSIFQSPVGSVKISGYAQLDYNQPLDSEIKKLGKLDVHRLVMLFGHRFNKKTTFVTEVEFEHVKEVYVEQAFLRYKIRNNFNLKAGLILIPMGIINEYHEPTTFFSVERPSLAGKVIPTTWREFGVGFTGVIPAATIKYQVYLVNGLASFTDEAKFGGTKGLRGGRQKGAEAIVSSPNLSSKINYYGLRNINIGLAGYYGKSQSSLINSVDRNDEEAITQADSSVVNIAMVGFDFRYNRKALVIRGSSVFSQHQNSKAYNEFADSDLGSQMMGFYIEAGYNVLYKSKTKNSLEPFVRVEQYDVHYKVAEGEVRKSGYRAEELIMGMNFKVANGAVYKADLQMVKTGDNNNYDPTLNLGIGIWF